MENEKRICVKCGIEKDILDFRFSDGRYRRDCKECENKRNREYNKKNKDKINKKRRQNYKENKNQIRDKVSKYYLQNKESKKKYNKEYYLNNKEYYKEKHKEYFQKNKEILYKKIKEWKTHNPEKVKINNKKDYLRRINNPVEYFKIESRTKIGDCFYDRKKVKIEEVVGCNKEKLTQHLLKTFRDNYGYDWDFIEKVNIDHKIPLYVASTIEEVKKLNHYSNLQLLKKIDNLRKGKNIMQESSNCAII